VGKEEINLEERKETGVMKTAKLSAVKLSAIMLEPSFSILK
jgi:hypothetical protein